MSSYEQQAAYNSQQAALASQCQECKISACRIKSVWGEGALDADYFFLGEAPGYWENQHGIPFYPYAAAGRQLTRLIGDLGLERASVYIANVIKCRPPNNRDPHPLEVANCRRFLSFQLDLIQPKLIIVMGRVATEALGLRWLERQGKYYSTYHPAYIARQPGQYPAWLEGLKEQINA